MGSGVGHLARRFLGSVSPRPPAAADSRWAEGHLAPGEVELWHRLGRADRRHLIAVARRVEASLGARATRPVLAAALLHDVGKLASHLGTAGRVVATVAIKVAGPKRASAWVDRRGLARRVGLYAQHEPLGADLLEGAGSDPLTVDLVRQQFPAAEGRTVDAALADALRAADDA